MAHLNLCLKIYAKKLVCILKLEIKMLKIYQDQNIMEYGKAQLHVLEKRRGG